MNFISLNLTGPWGSNLFRGPSNCLPNLSRVTHTHCPHLSQPHPLQTSLCSLPSLTTESLPHDNESPIHSPWALRTWHSCLLFPPSTYISPVCLLVYVCVQLLSHVQLFTISWTAVHQASLSIIDSWVYSKSCPLSWWCHPTISSSVIPFSSCLQS